MTFNIIVCVKQVPDPKHLDKIDIDEETKRIRREGAPAVLNPADKHALEEALRIKERLSKEDVTTKITAVSMGLPQAKTTLKLCLAMGADDAILLSDKAFSGADALATSFTLATCIKKIGEFDLILCGSESTDGGTAQVAPELAAFLDAPHAVFVKEIEQISSRKKEMTVKRSLEDGYMRVRIKMPAVLSVTTEINRPRYPTASMIMKAMKKEIKIWNAMDISIKEGEVGLSGSPTRSIEIFKPDIKEMRKRRRIILKGPPEEVSEEAVKKLRELGAI